MLAHGRLPNDIPWTIPIVLEVNKDETEGISHGDMLGLTYNGAPTATLEIEDTYSYDKDNFAESVFGTTDINHMDISKVKNMKDFLIGGRIRLTNDIRNPHPDYTLRPKATRILFKEKGWRTVVSFQTRNPPRS